MCSGGHDSFWHVYSRNSTSLLQLVWEEVERMLLIMWCGDRMRTLVFLWTVVTKPCGTVPGGSPELTGEQVSIRYRAGRGLGGGYHKSSWHLPYLLLPLWSLASKWREIRREKIKKNGVKCFRAAASLRLWFGLKYLIMTVTILNVCFEQQMFLIWNFTRCEKSTHLSPALWIIWKNMLSAFTGTLPLVRWIYSWCKGIMGVGVDTPSVRFDL